MTQNALSVCKKKEMLQLAFLYLILDYIYWWKERQKKKEKEEEVTFKNLICLWISDYWALILALDSCLIALWSISLLIRLQHTVYSVPTQMLHWQVSVCYYNTLHRSVLSGYSVCRLVTNNKTMPFCFCVSVFAMKV